MFIVLLGHRICASGTAQLYQWSWMMLKVTCCVKSFCRIYLLITTICLHELESARGVQLQRSYRTAGGLLKVTGSHIRCKSGNIAETVHARYREVVTIQTMNTKWYMTYWIAAVPMTLSDDSLLAYCWVFPNALFRTVVQQFTRSQLAFSIYGDKHLRPPELVCGILSRSSCAIQTFPVNGYTTTTTKGTPFWRTMNTALCNFWYWAP